MSNNQPQPFNEIDKRTIVGIEITSVSPSLDNLVVRHERDGFERNTWMQFLQAAQTPENTNRAMGYTYVSAYRLTDQDDWTLLAAPEVGIEPSVNARIQAQVAAITGVLQDQKTILLGHAVGVPGVSDLDRVDTTLEMVDQLRELLTKQTQGSA